MTERRFKSKVCLVGESSVGKTSLIKKYVLDIFDDKYISTIGTKITKKSQIFDIDNEKIDMDMIIWDIMGQPSFRALLQDAYFYGAQGILAVCDTTRIETLKDIHGWIDSVRDVIGDVPIIFLANKNDLKDQMTFGQTELDQEVSKYGMPAFFSSAKTGENVDNAFTQLGRMILERADLE